MNRRGTEHHRFRLPIGPSAPPDPPCARNSGPVVHDKPIRFGLMRYGRQVGSILLCGRCFLALNPQAPSDPLDVSAA